MWLHVMFHFRSLLTDSLTLSLTQITLQNLLSKLHMLDYAV